MLKFDFDVPCVYVGLPKICMKLVVQVMIDLYSYVSAILFSKNNCIL